MAEFCLQCGEDYDIGNDGVIAARAAGLTAEQVEAGYLVSFLCEGCGITMVDHEGRCRADCDRHHQTE